MDALSEQVGAVVADILGNPLVRLATAGFVAYVTVIWIASAYWVLQDMRRRHEDPMVPFVAATGVLVASPVLFPLALIVYRIVRPGETLAETRERELGERLEVLEASMALTCPGCARSVEEDWLVCPVCRSRLAHRCASCGRTMGLDWSLCAWCGTEFGRPVLPERMPRAVSRVALTAGMLRSDEPARLAGPSRRHAIPRVREHPGAEPRRGAFETGA